MEKRGNNDGDDTRDCDPGASAELLSSGESSLADGPHGTMTSIVSSISKYFRRDHDEDDGAPTSSSTSTKHQRDEPQDVEGGESRERVVSFDSSAESTPRKLSKKSKPSSTSTSPQTPPRGLDLSSVDMKSSWDGTAANGGSSKGERTGGKTGFEVPAKLQAGLLADPAKIAKEREKEERVRQARERLMEERQKKLEELREQQKMAQENREKQLEMRRQKIEDLRKRDIERRVAVEERRKMKEDVERARRESILQKAEERVARYEAWKAGGRKGGRGHVLGFGSATPRDICQPLERPRRSSSQSAIQRRSPNGSDLDSMRPQRRALSACSVGRRHVDSVRIGTFMGGDSPPKQLSVSTSVLYTKNSQEYSSMNTLHPHSRLATSMGTTTSTPAATHYYPRPLHAGHGINPLALASMTASLPSPVRMRESKGHRKPRPASVASCPPSLTGGDSAKSRRSKSTDRPGRDRSRTRQSRRESGERNTEGRKGQTEESGEKTQKDTDAGKEPGETKEKKDRVSLSFSKRSSPKHKKKDQEQVSNESSAKKDGQIVRLLLPRKAYSTSNLATMKKKSSLREKHSPTHLKDSGPKLAPSKDAHRSAMTTSGGSLPAPARSVSPGRRDADRSVVRVASPFYKGSDRAVTPTPLITPPASATSTPTVPTPSPATLVTSASTTPSQSLTTSFADDGTRAPAQDISADEYKARLAEKRRQAREKAEKEAEEEKKRQEDARLADEERQRKEEEDEKIFEEESLRLAEEAQKVEEVRLQRAIEAEEKRRKEEAEKLEQEKRSKEETERKAKAESERVEKEKQEKSRKEDEERLQRKKKLEMIMKRVKTDTDSQPKMESPTKPSNMFPGVTHLNSSQSSPDEEQERSVVSSELSDEEAPGLTVAEGSAVEVYSAAMTMSFMQDFEEDDMIASNSMSTSVATTSKSTGNILDGLSFGSSDHKHGGSDHAGSMPGEPEEATIWSEVAQRMDKERQQKASDHDKVGKEEAEVIIAKEEMEKKASVLTNHVEKEKHEQGRKEDEERLMRKKKLEMIMKRVKTDTDSQPKMESPTKPSNMFPGVTHLNSSQSSPDEEQERSVVSSELSDEEAPGLTVAEGSAVEVYSAAMTMSFMQDFEESDMTASTSSSTSTVTRCHSSGNILDGPSFRNEDQDRAIEERSRSAGTTPLKPEEKAISSEATLDTKSKFKSPLLQHLVENKSNDSSAGPKFKSPLLQNLLGKTKVGARMGLSASAGDLSPSRETAPSQSQAGSYMTFSASSLSSNSSPRDQSDGDKTDVEQSPKSSDRYIFSNGVGKDSGDAHFPTSSSKSSFDCSPFEGTKLFTPMSDSALGSSIEPYGDGVMSQSAVVVTNGHGHYTGHPMEDSSINLYCVDEGVTKSSNSPFETLTESDKQEQTLASQGEGQFNDLIDFGGAPGREFEESSRSDVTDYLS